VVIAGRLGGQDTERMLNALRSEFVPSKVVLFRPEGHAPEITRLAAFTEHQTSVDGQATAYVCRNYMCEVPTTDTETMVGLLRADR
jgi:uncharacterized protein YyaL (SSP411 family)